MLEIKILTNQRNSMISENQFYIHKKELAYMYLKLFSNQFLLISYLLEVLKMYVFKIKYNKLNKTKMKC